MVLASWLVVLLFAAAMLALGFAARRAESRCGADGEGFWTAHRSLTGWSLGMSLSASMLSVSWSLVYGVELFYRYGWGGLWLLSIPWLLVLLLFATLAPRFRAFAAFSQGELFGKVYGRGSQLLAVLVISLVFLTWCGAEIAATGQALAPALAISPAWTMAGLALLVASYTWTGGFRAVVLTDVAQFFLIAAFFLLTASRLPSPSFTPLAKVSGPSWQLVLTTLVVYVSGWLAEADIWLRLTAARDNRHARLAMVFTMGVSVPLVVLFPALLAAAARSYFPNPQELSRPVLSALLARVLSPQQQVLVLGGLLAVGASTVSTTANVVAVSWARDWPKARWPGAGLSWARLSSAAAVFAALGVALASRSLAELFYLSGGLLSAALLWPTIGLLRPGWQRAAPFAGWVGLAAIFAAFALERSGLLSFSNDAGMRELGVGYVLPALGVSALAFVLRLPWVRNRRKGSAP